MHRGGGGKAAAPGESLANLTGVTVEEFGRIGSADKDGLFPQADPSFGRKRYVAESTRRTFDIRIGNEQLRAAHLYELLELGAGAESVANWASRFTEGRCSISVKKVGAGRVYYVGTYLTDELISTFLLPELAKQGVQPLVADLPQGVEVVMREDARGELLFVLNTTPHVLRVDGLPQGKVIVGVDLVDGASANLPPFECVLLLLRPGEMSE